MYDCKITEYFEDLETDKAYDGYFYTVAQGITIVILGALCGLRNTRQIWQCQREDKRIFKGEIPDQTYSLLFLMSYEIGQACFFKQMFCSVGSI